MKVGSWKRSLLAGALAALALAPLAAHAAPTDAVSAPNAGPVNQWFGLPPTCQTLGSPGLGGSALGFGGLSQISTLGSGGMYGPYYNPAYGSQGLGSFVGSFMNYSGGQPSPFAVAAGSPYCAGMNFGGVANLTTTPCVVQSWGTYATNGFQQSIYGPQPLGGVNFMPFSTSPFGGFQGGVNGGVVCR